MKTVVATMKTCTVCLVCLLVYFILNTAAIPFSEDDYESNVIEPNAKAPVMSASLGENDLNSGPSLRGLLCGTCKTIAGFVQDLFKQGKSEDFIAKAAIDLCIKLKIEDTRVCDGIIPMFRDEVLTVFDKVGLNPDEVCGVLLGPSCGDVGPLYPDWNVTFPKTQKPPVGREIWRKDNSTIYKILHLSDIHIDLQYAEGSNISCDEPLCCRKYNGVGKAGYWGSYGSCDIPLRTLEATFQHIKQKHTDIDMVYWTGDIPGHNVWNQSRDDQIEVMKAAVKLFIQYFPHIPVYPAVGNHESSPVNSFPPPFIDGKSSNKWLLDAFADFWSFWLPEKTMPTIKKGGYFTTLHSNGFRIVSLNNNYCNNQNWWLLINNTDPAGELQWLINVLQEAENNNEKVHILGHIPPGRTTCLKHWSANFYKIIDRYESTVAAQFYGHTHEDHFELFYDVKEMKRPTSMAYIGPSLTTYSNYNPSYRVYEVDGTTAAVLDHSTYILDLSKSTKDVMAWRLEYSAKDTYDMKSLQAADWDDLVTRFEKNQTLFQTYYKYKFKSSPSSPTCTSKACIADELCDLRTGRSYDKTFCANRTNLLPYDEHC